MPEHGAKVFLDDKEVGFIGSLARHYELGPIALAVVKRNVALDATLFCEGVTAFQEALLS
jgi:folate-binding Fe-S cluster repair protein YgfZ